MGYNTMGDVMGDEDVDGDYETVGVDEVGRRIVRRRKRRHGATLQLPAKPNWRDQLAPGVPVPGEGLQPLPLRPDLNGGVFTLGFERITFSARPQVPFHPERLLCTVRRAGTNAGGVIIEGQNLFVGRDLQLVELGAFDIEFFSPTAFGVRLQLDAAQPGVLISLECSVNPAGLLTSTDTVAVSLMFLGRSIR